MICLAFDRVLALFRGAKVTSDLISKHEEMRKYIKPGFCGFLSKNVCMMLEMVVGPVNRMTSFSVKGRHFDALITEVGNQVAQGVV